MDAPDNTSTSAPPKPGSMEVEIAEETITFAFERKETPKKPTYRTFDPSHQEWLRIAAQPAPARPPPAPDEGADEKPLSWTRAPAKPENLLCLGPIFETSIILISGILVSTIKAESYQILHQTLGLKFGLRPDFARMTSWWTTHGQERLFFDESALSKEPATCSIPTFIEPEKFSSVGEGISVWPQLFRMSADVPAHPGLRKRMWAQAVPGNYLDYIDGTEIMALRGVPLDDTGAAAGAILSAVQAYIRASTPLNTIVLAAPRSIKIVPNKSGTPAEEVFLLVFAHGQVNRADLMAALQLGNLGAHRAVQNLGVWAVQVALSYGNLCEANPNPVILEYHMIRITGLELGIDALEAVTALLANPENRMGGVFLIYPDRFLLRENHPPGPGDSDHLVCVYPAGVSPPVLFLDLRMRDLLRGPGSWRTMGVGHPVPGWAKMLSYYRWLAGDSSYLSSLNIGDRTSTVRAPKGKEPIPPQPTSSSLETRALSNRIVALERSSSLAPTAAGVDKLVRLHALPILRGIIKDEIKSEMTPYRRDHAELREMQTSMGDALQRVQGQVERLTLVDDELDQKITRLQQDRMASAADAERLLRFSTILEDRLRSLEAYDAGRLQAATAIAEAHERLESRVAQLEQFKGGKRPLDQDANPSRGGSPST